MGTLSFSTVASPGQEASRWILFLHGILGSGANWRTVAKRLLETKPGWGAALVDLRNHGASQGLPGDNTLASVEADLDGVAAALPGPVEAIAGHSYGGKVAMQHVVRRGLFHVMEGRRIFEDLTVEENLTSATFALSGRRLPLTPFDLVYSYFPALYERRKGLAGYLSGGEQQMLVIGRALMSTPRVILLDEPSLGLAPMLVEEIFQIVQRLNREEKLTVLLVEQNATLALGIADHGYVMENGRIVLEGSAEALRSNADIKEFYLGLTDVGARKSYRDVKHYKRRKRWLS